MNPDLSPRAAMLQSRIQQELGIDMRKYASTEVVVTLANLLSFPQYVLSYLLRPLGVAVALFVLGLFVVDLVHIEYLLYLILVPGLLLATAVLIGLLALGWKIERDLRGIVEYTLGVLGTVLGDVQRAGTGLQRNNFYPTLNLLFQGMMHIVTIPTTSQIIRERIPIVGGLFARLISRTLTFFVDRCGQIAEGSPDTHTTFENPQQFLAAFEASIGSLSQGLTRLLGVSRRITQLPLKIALGICVLVLYAVVRALH